MNRQLLSRYNFFAPEEIINEYFSVFGGSLNNSSSSIALRYHSQVESLRILSSRYFGLEEGYYCSIQFNQYYIERALFEYLSLDESWVVYTNEPENVDFHHISHNIYDLDSLHSLSLGSIVKHRQNILIWLFQPERLDERLKSRLSELVEFSTSEKNIRLYIYLSLDNLLYDFPELQEITRMCDFVSFSPFRLLEESGTLLLWVRKEIPLKPLFLGSNASYISRTNGLQIMVREVPHSLEFGTQNIISLIVLERYFYFLGQNISFIKSRLLSKRLNFNLRSSFCG